MRESSGGRAPLWGVVGLVVGTMAGALFMWWGGRVVSPVAYGPGGGGIAGIGIGVPEVLILLVPALWVAFWVVLIGALVKFLWGGRGWYHGRLEDLPADFDDWHRRAHERMREAHAADDPGRRG